MTPGILRWHQNKAGQQGRRLRHSRCKLLRHVGLILARRGDVVLDELEVEGREAQLGIPVVLVHVGDVPRQRRVGRHEERVRGRLRAARRRGNEGLRSEVNIELNFPPKLRGARSRLYRRRFLQVNTRWKALAEIYTMHSFAPLWNPLAKNGEKRAWPKQPRKGGKLENERPISSAQQAT